MSVQTMKTNIHHVIEALPENKIQGLYIFLRSFVTEEVDDTFISDKEFEEIEQIVFDMKNGEYVHLNELDIK